MPTSVQSGLLFDDQLIEEFVQEVRQTPSQEAFVSEAGIANALDELSGGDHRGHNHLVHDVVEDYHLQVVKTEGKVSQVVYWQTSSMLIKIRQIDITRVGGKVTEILITQYDENGDPVESLTSTINRVGGKFGSLDAEYQVL